MKFFKLTTYLFFALIFFQNTSEARWTLNDVTYLLPLPSDLNQKNVLAPYTSAGRGTLVPLSVVKNFVFLDKHETIEESYRKLRVVAIRLDPCFKMSGICKSQIRLVLQPLSQRWGKTISQDTAVHAFYNLSELEFNDLLTKLQKIKSEFSPNEYPLQVHPTILKEGYSGKFSSQFFPLILSYIGQQNLVRVTAAQLFIGADKWGFLGFDIENGMMREISIPRINSTFQTFRVATVNGQNFYQGKINPEPQDTKDLFGQLVEAPEALQNSAILQNGAIVTRRVENPDIHSPETMDCVSCHLSQAAGGVVFGTRPDLLRDAEVEKWSFNSISQNLGSRKRDVRVLRSLGYFNDEPITNNRVINESQAVVDYLNFKR